MTSIVKPKIVHKGLSRNKLGLTIRDYEGGMSTLCAGCGHDSITAAIVQAFFELDVLLVEDTRLLPRCFARLQRCARAHAVDCHWRCRRQS